MKTFYKRTQGRIYVDKEENIDKVKEIIKKIDEYEATYLPNDLITTFEEDAPTLVNVHKFDGIDMEILIPLCWKQGIYIYALGENRWNDLPYKGYCRIYVDKVDNISKVKEIALRVNPEEEGYLNDDLFAPFSKYPEVKYSHKVELNIDDLINRCWKNGIYIWALCSDRNDEYYSDKTLEYMLEGDIK